MLGSAGSRGKWFHSPVGISSFLLKDLGTRLCFCNEDSKEASSAGLPGVWMHPDQQDISISAPASAWADPQELCTGSGDVDLSTSASCRDISSLLPARKVSPV